MERLILPNVVMEERSALDPDTENFDKADVVICDVPCSGLGVMSRKTDIKYHVKKDSAKVLSQQGLEILKKGASLVKKGGKLLFSTCTILPEENQENRERFLNWQMKSACLLNLWMRNSTFREEIIVTVSIMQ